MKGGLRVRRILPLLLALLALSGCRGAWYSDEYSYVNEHLAPYAVRETTEAPTVPETEAVPAVKTVSNLYQIRDRIVELVLAGEESGSFLVQDYTGSLEADTKEIFGRILKDYPKYNYAMDSFDCSVSHVQNESFVNVNMKLHLSPQELRAIESRSYQNALPRIYKALGDQVNALTIQISSFPEDADLYALLDDYILHHPAEIVDPPGITIGVYPDRGDTRVVELHFVYDADSDTLSRRKSTVETFFNWVYSNHLDPEQSAAELVEALYNNLVPPGDYTDSEKATVYTQVVGQKLGSSRTMASVVEYFCNRIGADCEIVVGQREGESWYWNRIQSEGRWYMFDLHAAALSGQPPVLLPASEMIGYSWDMERYPELEDTIPPESGESPETQPVTEAAQTANTEAIDAEYH